MSNAWATAYKSYIDDKMQASTTISSSNVSSGSVGVISWTGAGCTYSSNRVNIEANGSITFTASPGYNITKIVIVSGSASAYYGTWTSSPIVTPKSESGTTTFEGLSANSVTVTTSTAFRCTSASYISIYYESASSTSACAIPTFSPAAGTYTSAQDVTINCATEGATIYYTTDGSAPTTSSSRYSSAIHVDKTTTLKAVAVKSGMNDSGIASADYTIVETYANIAALSEAATSTSTTSYVNLSNAFVTYVDGNYAYIQDNSGAIVLYKSNHGLKAGNLLNGTASVTYALRYGNPQLADINDVTVTQGETPEPTEIAASSWDKTFNAELSKFYKITDATITENGGKYFINLGDELVQLYGQGDARNFTLSNLSKKYTIVGFPTLYVSGENITQELQIFEVPEIQTYQITAVVNNSAYGTAVYDNGVITATPADGYRLATPAYSVTNGTATVTQDGNEFVVDAETNCTIQINFEPIPTHTVTFSVNGTETKKSFAEGSNITFDNPADEFEKSFIGWTTDAIDGTTDECPELVSLGTMGSEDKTFYAVFANKVSGSSPSLTKMTSTDEFKAGDKVVIVANGTVAMYQATINTSYVNKYTFVNDVAKIAADDKNWFDVSAGSSDGTWKLGDETNGYVYSNSSNDLKISTKNSTDFTLAWNNDENKFTLVGNGRWLSYRSDLSNNYFRLGGEIKAKPLGKAYFDIYKYISGNITYSDYCTTVVEPVTLSAPIIFHDGGEYEDALTVAIAGEGTIMYKLGADVEATAYTAPITINATTTVTAWAEKDGVKSNEVTKTFTIVEKQAGAEVPDGYYNIMTNDGKYVNVAGRKTVTLVSDNEGKAGTVIRVKADAEGVKVLRSQGVDVPGYAKKAMNYVPEIVQLAVDKLHAEGSGAILGEHGLDAIMEEFNKSFDYNLYLEKSGDAYRIYGRTPSMKPVVDFYAKNKANVDAKLPQLEAFINSAIDKVLEKTGGRGGSILVDFKLHDVWQNMDGTLTEPVDEASTMKFYEEVLTSETNVWNFAYQTAMIYWGNLKNHPRFPEIKDKLGDYAKYIDKVENIRPNFKYYIVPSGSGVDFISQGNEAIINNNASAAWTMQAVTTFQVELPTEKNVTVYPTSGGTQRTYKEYYTTLYTDFAYTLREGVKAYKVTAIDEKTGVAKREEITGTIPAQTPVLLVGVGESNTATLTLSTEAGTAITGNLLVGPDALINEYQIKTPQVVSLFDFAKEILGESAYKAYVEKYEHLMLKNAGTVNNKYFFGLTEDDLGDVTNLRILGMGYENELGFHDIWEKIDANKAFILTNDYDPVKLFLVGDVNRDGAVSIADVTALVNIILGKAKYPEDNDKYDFEAANVNGDKTISIADVTALVNIILGK